MKRGSGPWRDVVIGIAARMDDVALCYTMIAGYEVVVFMGWWQGALLEWINRIQLMPILLDRYVGNGVGRRNDRDTLKLHKTEQIALVTCHEQVGATGNGRRQNDVVIDID